MHSAIRTLSVAPILFVCATASSALAQPSNVEIDAAIQKAIAYLYSQQNPEGHWETAVTRNMQGSRWGVDAGQWGGRTAIATYALLAAGESPQDPRLVRAINWLLQADAMEGTYAVAMRAQVWNMLPRPPQPEIRAAIQRDLQILGANLRMQGRARGHYRYLPDEGPTTYDHSASQFGVLGTWALAQTNVVEIPPNYWRLVEEGWVRNQRADGGWNYTADQQSTMTMALAGVATLFITQDYVHNQAGALCRGNVTHPALERGLEYVAQNIGAFMRNSSHRDWVYGLYGIERVGLAGGIKYFGETNWYAEGATRLLGRQADNGSWTGRADQVPNTAFGLLFLVRGRQPVVMNKLAYDIQGRGGESEVGHWNQRPRDVANFTQWLSNLTERELHWQVVNLRVGAADLHDAPILYISGNQGLDLSEQDRSVLRQFIEQGGIVLANSDCTTGAFTNSLRKLGTDMFPAYEWRELPADHIVYRNQFSRDRWRARPSVLALGNGAREFMFIAPQLDFGRHWQLRQQAGRDEIFQLPANIFFYATDRQNLPFKGESYIVQKDSSVKAERSLRLARLQYSGNWNPEPGGWQRIANIMHNRHKLDLQVETVQLGKDRLEGFAAAHITGTTSFSLTDAARQELRQFVENGGVLIADAAGGSGQFATSMEQELESIFSARPRTLAASHDVFAASGERMEHFGYRTFALQRLGGMRGPQLQAVERDERAIIFFSPQDLSVGLVGQEVDGIYGYAPATATALMQNMLLHIAKE